MTVPVMDRPRPVSAERNYYLAVVAMIFGRVGNMAANLASMALIARAVSPASFGQYVLIVGVIAICAQVADFGTTAVFAKQTPEHQTRYRVFWGNFLLVRLALLVPAFVAAAIAAFFLQEETGSVLLAACLAIPFVAARFFDPMYQVFGRPWSLGNRARHHRRGDRCVECRCRPVVALVGRVRPCLCSGEHPVRRYGALALGPYRRRFAAP